MKKLYGAVVFVSYLSNEAYVEYGVLTPKPAVGGKPSTYDAGNE
jgi:hypothetical protein